MEIDKLFELDGHLVKHNFIDTTIGKVFYLDCGNKDGIACLFLHGWSVTASVRNWLFMYEPLVKEGYRIIAIDMPGFGKSNKTLRPFNCRSESNFIKNGPIDIITQILDQLKIENFSVFGFSWGGGLAISLALKLPSKILNIILFMPSYTEMHNELDEIKAKTLILWFKEDQIHSFKIGRYFSKRIKTSKYYELSCGHFNVIKCKNNYEEFKCITVPIFLNFLKE